MTQFMTESDVLDFVSNLDNVYQQENFGYTFFFVGDDRIFAFVTLARSDNEYDRVSNLNREGVFRINIGVSRATFNSMFSDTDEDNIDYSALNVVMPHPDYAKQNFVCILNPSDDNIDLTKKLIVEAHSRAVSRQS